MARALVLHRADNVATLLSQASEGEAISLFGEAEGEVRAASPIPRGHKVALRPIRKGEPVFKYGEPIGVATSDILPGEHVHVHNLSGLRGRGEGPKFVPFEGRAKWEPPPIDGLPGEFLGFPRPEGGVGVRNLVLLLPTVVCSCKAAELASSGLKGVATFSHPYGCTFSRRENEFLERMFVRFGAHPNVAGVVVLALGCETVDFQRVAEEISRRGRPVELVVVQREGGVEGAAGKARRAAKGMAAKARRQGREPFPLSELVVGVECGASDAFSGLTANPAVGVACDLLVAAGGTVILSETPELIGSEHLLAARARDEEVARRLLEAVRRAEEALSKTDAPEEGAFITPGNIEGGITTLEEKSLGCVRKGGTSPLAEVLGYGEAPRRKGLIFMDTPGHDVKSVTGMVAGGAQLVLFTTGRGTPTGCPIAPVIKVSSNTQCFERMGEDIDFDAGPIASGAEGVGEAGRRIFRLMVEVASGKPVKAELRGHSEFALPLTP